MNVVPIALLVVALLRGALWVARNARDPAPAAARAKAPPTDVPFTAWVIGVTVLAGIVSTLTLGVGALVAVPLWALAVEPWWWAWPLALRLREPRLAWLAARVSGWTWRHDRVGGAAFASAWTAVRTGRDPEPWIGDPPRTSPITAGVVTGAALVAGAQGGRVEAARLLRISRWFDARPLPERRAVAEWLAAEAAARGDWQEVLRLAAEEPATPALGFLGAVAGRLLDEPDATDVIELERAWAASGLATHADPELRASASALLERARRARHRVAPEPPPLPADPLVAALEAHRRAMLAPSWIAPAAAAWSAVDDQLPARVRERVVEELAERYAALPDRPALPGALGFEVRDRVVQRALAHLTLQCRALQARVNDQRDLDPASEAREFAALAATVEHVLGPAHLRASGNAAAELEVRTVFRAVYSPVTDWAADLYNRRRQPYLFRAVTWWLLDLARACADGEAVALYQRNLQVSRGWSAGREPAAG